MASSPITLCQTEREKVEAVTDFLFLHSKITADSDCSHEVRRHLLLGRKPRTNLDSVLKSRDITLLTNLHCQSVDFSSSHVRMWKMDHKNGWVVVLEKTLKSPWDCKEIKPVNPKGNQPWLLIGRTDAEAEASILWPPDVKSWLSGKDLDVGKDWGQEEKGARGWDGWMASLTQWTWVWANWEIVGGQGNLACCCPWGRKESDTTERLNNNRLWLYSWNIKLYVTEKVLKQ